MERIEFSLEAPAEDPSVLEEERKKHAQRAERFGTDFRDPARRKEFRLEARKERLAGEGFITGIDMFSQEERAKRAARAAKFGRVAPDPLAYAPDPEELKRAARGAKFGTGYNPDAQLMDMDLHEAKADAPPDAPRRPDAVYLYGVDVMSTAECKGYFGDYAPTFVEWINDSSCVVLFADAASAARAIVGTGHPLPAEAEAPDAGGQAGLDPTSTESLPYLWHKGKAFVKGGTPISLMYRMATEADRKDPGAPRRSRNLWKTAGGGQQRGGGGGGARGGARKRQQHNGGGMDGYEEYGPGAAGGGGGGSGEGDAPMRRGRGERGGERLRRRKRVKQLDGSYRDVEMEDAGDDGVGQGGGGEGGGGDEGGGGGGRRAADGGVDGGGEGGAPPPIDTLAPESFEEVVPADEE